ncbi:MAG: tetratricopeptide repeat protein [Pseudomonadota bacterium]
MKTRAATAISMIALVWFILGDNNHAFAQSKSLDDLMTELRDPELQDWESVERQIWDNWYSSGSDAIDLLLRRGQDALEFGLFDDAIGHFTAVIDHAPEYAEGWNARATAYFHAGRFGLSMSDIQQVLALNPDHFGALTGMAMILEQTGELEDALEVVNRVLSIHPHRPDVKMAQERLELATRGTSL